MEYDDTHSAANAFVHSTDGDVCVVGGCMSEDDEDGHHRQQSSSQSN